MTQDTRKGGVKKRDGSASDQSQRNKEKREKDVPPTKVIIRRLPPSMTMEIFLDQISPVPDHDYMYFVKADMSLGQYGFSRAYINFVNQDDIFVFKDKFDGYVFVDRKGNEFPAIVEFSPFQKIPKKKVKKKDAKCGTIEQDPDYVLFLDSLSNPEKVNLPSAEFHLEEIENRERELRANNGVPLMTTPLIEFLKQKKAEKIRIREEKREERKRRELEKKRMKEEERRRRKEKEKDRDKSKDKNRDKDRLSSDDKSRGITPVKLLKNLERENSRSKEGIEKESHVERSHDLGTSDPQHFSTGSNQTTAEAWPDRYRKDSSGSSKPRGTGAGPPNREKDWEAERRRRQEEEKQKYREKQRERRERERDRYKKTREEQQQQHQQAPSGPGKVGFKSVRPNASSTDGQLGGAPSTVLAADDRPRTKPAPRNPEWQPRDRAPAVKGEGGNQQPLAHQAPPFGGRSGGGGERLRGGKSYEKSRESMAKARGENRGGGGGSGGRKGGGGGGGGGGGAPVVRGGREVAETEDGPMAGSENAVDENICCESREEVRSREDGEIVCADESRGGAGTKNQEMEGAGGHQPRNRRERHGDPRTERRIRNKDRPSIELYRPGMRRLSLQRNSPQKDSPSSSSSPSPTAQMLGQQMRGESGVSGGDLPTGGNSQGSGESDRVDRTETYSNSASVEEVSIGKHHGEDLDHVGCLSGDYMTETVTADSSHET